MLRSLDRATQKGAEPAQNVVTVPDSGPMGFSMEALRASTVPTEFGGRRVLPVTRRSVTHKFSVAGFEGYLTVGHFENGAPGEIFIKMSKEGSTLSGLIQGFCMAFSLALQYGLPLSGAVDRFRGMRFEPSGPTDNPDIPVASSILDYVARYLELHYIAD